MGNEGTSAVVPPPTVENIFIPTWRVVDERVDAMDLDSDDDSSSEETADAHYEVLHQVSNKQLVKLIERARKEAEDVKRLAQARDDSLAQNSQRH